MPCKHEIAQAKKMRIISITGGKGGIGKSTLSINLATAFAKANRKVLLFDADLGLANLDVLLGLHVKKNIHDVFAGDCSLNDICLTGPHGIRIIPAASGIQKMTALNCVESARLIKAFSSLSDNVDVMIVDLASGITRQVIDFTHASQDILIVLCNDPTSLADSYAVIKILHQQYARSRFGVIVNKVAHEQEGCTVFGKFQTVLNQFMNVTLNYLGCVPNDDYIKLAAQQHVAVLDKYPHALASIALQHVARGILNWNDSELAINGGIHYFFERLIKSQAIEEQQ